MFVISLSYFYYMNYWTLPIILLPFYAQILFYESIANGMKETKRREDHLGNVSKLPLSLHRNLDLPSGRVYYKSKA